MNYIWMLSSHEVHSEWLFIKLTNCILLVQREPINKEWCNHFEFTTFHHIKHLVCFKSCNPNFRTNHSLDSSCHKTFIVTFSSMFYTLVELSCVYQNLDSCGTMILRNQNYWCWWKQADQERLFCLKFLLVFSARLSP